MPRRRNECKQIGFMCNNNRIITFGSINEWPLAKMLTIYRDVEQNVMQSMHFVFCSYCELELKHVTMTFKKCILLLELLYFSFKGRFQATTLNIIQRKHEMKVLFVLIEIEQRRQRRRAAAFSDESSASAPFSRSLSLGAYALLFNHLLLYCPIKGRQHRIECHDGLFK